MNIKLGADSKRVGILIGLLVVAAILYFLNRDSGVPSTPSRPATSTTATEPAPGGQQTAVRPVSRTTVRATQGGINRGQINLKPKPNQNLQTIDPTLHLDALAKLQDVKVEGVSRSLFEIQAAPPAAVLASKEPGPIHPTHLVQGPPAPPPPAPPPPTPKAPKIPLKFYGFVNPARPDIKRAFFLDGEDIVIAGEGETIKKRYKIVRIGVNSAVVEDTTFKGDNTTQTLPLEAELPG